MSIPSEATLVSRLGPRRTGVLALAVAMSLWVVVEVISSGAVRSMNPLQLVWGRYGVHLLAMTLLLAPRKGFHFIRTKYPFIQLGRSLLMLGMPLAWVGALETLSYATVMGLFWLAPLVAISMSALFLREWPSRRSVLVTIAGYLGAIAVLRPPLPGDLRGMLFVGAMLACFAGYLVLTRWLRREATATNLFYSALGVFLALTPFMSSIWREPSPRVWLIVVAVGLIGFIVLHQIDRALHLAEVAVIIPVAFVQPLIVVGLRSRGHLGALGAGQLLGMAVIVAAGFVSARLARSKPEGAMA